MTHGPHCIWYRYLGEPGGMSWRLMRAVFMSRTDAEVRLSSLARRTRDLSGVVLPASERPDRVTGRSR